ncbi:MAG: hypothetical protein K1X89_15220 [Myxococcaceae bacterium]|nr:hypothetical protein [Myxococcaceae bacterium]
MTLRTLLNAALRDGRVTSAEAKKAVDYAKRGGVQPSEYKLLHKTLLRNVDKFDAPAQQRFLFAGDVTHSFDGDPSNMKFHPGRLFEKGISMHDVNQGGQNDCTILAALAGLAARSPQSIKNMIRANPDGTVSVRFYSKTAQGVPHANWVTVDRDTGGTAYAHSKRPTEQWSALVEKAWAKFNGGFGANILSDGPKTIFALTGRQTHDGYLDKSATITKLRSDVHAGRVVTAFKKDGETGLPGGHDYTVLGIYKKNGVEYVSVRNPWGHTEPSGNGPDDGVFTLTMAQFRAHFTNVTNYDN